jgi:hypothetical protein
MAMPATKRNVFVSQHRLTGIALALLILVIAGGRTGWSVNAPPASAAEPKGEKVTALLRERLATLKEVAAEAVALYEKGSASIDQVHEADEAVLQAELDLADSPKARIAIREKLVAVAKKHEEHVSHLVKTGAGQPYMVLKAKVHRLEAEIALEREKEKQPDK